MVKICVILTSAVFFMNHPCDIRTDGEMDGRTERIAIAYARLAYMLSRAIKP